MYEVGDKVVHPAHGAGVISAVEEKDVHDDFSRYYVIDLAAQEMRLMVPVRMAEEIGLRPVANAKETDEVFQILGSEAEALPDGFKERQAAIGSRLKEGDPESLARVVRDMAARSREKQYSPTEARLYDQARNMLSGEMALSLDEDVDATLERIDEVVVAAAEAAEAAAAEAAAKEEG